MLCRSRQSRPVSIFLDRTRGVGQGEPRRTRPGPASKGKVLWAQSLRLQKAGGGTAWVSHSRVPPGSRSLSLIKRKKPWGSKRIEPLAHRLPQGAVHRRVRTSTKGKVVVCGKDKCPLVTCRREDAIATTDSLRVRGCLLYIHGGEKTY